MELRMENLTRQYGKKTAIDHLDSTLNAGVYGLLGSNGAGKTTLMRMLCGILRPTSGQVYYNEKPITELGKAYRDHLGYLPQNFVYYPEFTALDFLLYLSYLKGLDKNQAGKKSMELLELTVLTEEKDRKIKTFSGGMKQRLGIAQAMLNNPDILILDEPTTGLDPRERVRFRNLLSSFSQDKIVLLSTHIVSDIEYIANDILIMKSGRLIHREERDTITKNILGLVWECRVPAKETLQWNNRYLVGNMRAEASDVILRIISEEKPTESAVLVEPNLEDVYLYYFGKEENYGQTNSL